MPMTPETFLEALKTTLTKTKANALTVLAAQSNLAIRDVIDRCFYPEQQVAFRAAWILENVFMQHLPRFMPAADYFLDRFSEQQNPSCCRHFCKILAGMSGKKASPELKLLMQHYPIDTLIETVFKWLTDAKMPVAVKSHCLTILANFCAQRPWIAEELLAIIDFLMDKESIAFFSKARKIRQQLQN